jgi:hypothetical protein
LAGFQRRNRVFEFGFECGHFIQHAAGGVAHEDDAAGIAAVAKDRSAKPDGATAGRAESG